MALSRPKRRKRQRSGIRDDDGPLKCEAHLQWVRGHECTVASRKCDGKIEAHHETSRGAGGGDDTAVPLCAYHHRRRHDLGRITFRDNHGGVNLTQVAETLAARSPHLRKLRMKERNDD